MKTLFFKQRFIPLILNGEKTQTIRKKHFLKIDERFNVNFKHPTCRIVNIISKNLNEITDNEARQDGFKTKQELLDNIFQLYPDSKLTDKFHLLKFEMET